jgi:cell division protein FtsL
MGKRKKSKKPVQPKGTWAGIFLLLVLIGELFFFTWCRIQCRVVGYEISQEKVDYEKIIALQKKLKVELARLKSPERIAKIAREELGLTMPNPKQMVTIP